MKILWISPYAPYDVVAHGGGQNHNYYLKYLKKNTNYDITLLTVCDKDEKTKIDLDKYEIDHILKVFDNRNRMHFFISNFILWRDGGLLNNSRYHLLLEAIKEYSKRKINPDVIITQWTEATIFIDVLKKYFPNSKYIAIEEDVAFLGYQRKYKDAKGIYRIYRKIKYDILYKKELEALKKCDLVTILNDKDKKILLESGIGKDVLFQMCSYHKYYSDAQYIPETNLLLFYGAMSRKENYKSAIWFIQNVMPKLADKYKLIIVGSNPNEELKKYQSDRVEIKGYVEEVKPYFEKCLCLIAPLILGAGIKIKVLEALSAGLPVITNEIGAEGIGLVDGVNYLHCQTEEEYVDAINKLRNNQKLRERLSDNGKKHVNTFFDVDTALNRLIDRIEQYEEKI